MAKTRTHPIVKLPNGLGRWIGSIETSLRFLEERSEEDRELRARDHAENQAAMGDLRQSTTLAIAELRQTASDRYGETKIAFQSAAGELGELRRELQAHAAQVASIQAVPPSSPAIMSSQRMAAYASIGIATLIGLMWAAEAGVKWLVTWILSHLN